MKYCYIVITYFIPYIPCINIVEPSDLDSKLISQFIGRSMQLISVAFSVILSKLYGFSIQIIIGKTTTHKRLEVQCCPLSIEESERRPERNLRVAISAFYVGPPKSPYTSVTYVHNHVIRVLRMYVQYHICGKIRINA
jgi:hypothetical protein